MPLRIRKRGKKYCVEEPTGKRLGCHPSHKQALAQVQAVYFSKHGKFYPLLTRGVIQLLDELGYDHMKSQTTFRRGLRAQVRGLYDGLLTEDQFVAGMSSVLGRGFEQAITEALRACGRKREDLGPADEARIQEELRLQESFVRRLAQHVEHLAADDYPVSLALDRAELWVPVYLRIKNMARLMGCHDQSSIWRYGDTQNHCWHALTYDGQVYPNGVWLNTLGPLDLLPQGRGLQCRGYRCMCQLLPTDQQALPGKPDTVVTDQYGYLAKAVVPGVVFTVALPGHVYTQPGKSVWPTAEAAAAALSGDLVPGVVLADWNRDTMEVPGESWRALREATVTFLDSEQWGTDDPAQPDL